MLRRRPSPDEEAATLARLRAALGRAAAPLPGPLAEGATAPRVESPLTGGVVLAPVPGWRAALAGRIPSTLRGAVADPSRSGMQALAALAAVAVLAAGWLFWRSRPQPTVVEAPALVATASVSASAALLVVDVSGAVRRPGLVRLPPGSRVADAILAAGGVRPGASTIGVNLARKVNDGEQIAVGASPPPAAAGPGSVERGALLDLNSATLQQLEALPGVGPVLAQRILDWRTSHGRFDSVEQLQEVAGIGPRKYDDIRTRVTV